ncbi:hypothetical protein [Hyphomonas sp.]
MIKSIGGKNGGDGPKQRSTKGKTFPQTAAPMPRGELEPRGKP